MKAIAVLSSSHSGSTFFTLALGKHPEIVNLGEVYLTFVEGPVEHRMQSQTDCFCGDPIDKCIFWSKILERKKTVDPKEKNIETLMFSILMEVFREVMGENKIPVFTLKRKESIRALKSLNGVDVSIVHLTRDVRSYSASRVANYRRKNLGSRFQFHAFYTFEWLIRNARLNREIQALGIGFERVGYEEMCFNLQSVLSKIAEFVDIPPFPVFSSVEGSNSHVLRGNRLRGQPYKWTLRYDERWLVEGFVFSIWLLYPFVYRMNQALVYSTGTTEFWERDNPDRK